MHVDVRTHPMPPRVAALPRDPRGYPIFATVQNPRGHWSFLAIVPEQVVKCATKHLCGICGQSLGYWMHFVGAEESLTTRVFAEPPMHPDCLQYAMEVCPFLMNPHYRRVQERADRPEGTVHHPDGVYIDAARFAIYRTRSYRFVIDKRIPLFIAAPAKEVFWIEGGHDGNGNVDSGNVDEHKHVDAVPVGDG